MTELNNAFMFALICAAGLVSWVGTALVMRHNLKLGLIQPPNARSSHDSLTPHGGGIGIVIGGTVAGAALLLLRSDLGRWSILFLALLIAITGLTDDIRQLSARTRLGIQLVATGLLLAALHPLPALTLPYSYNLAGIALGIVLFFGGIWWLNLFNFMDGIDGLAGSQAAFMLIAASLFAACVNLSALSNMYWYWMLAISASSIGFLCLNWPPARIFMGDVGSTYLGFIIFALALCTVRDGLLSYASWLILGAFFIVDASMTLLRRLLTRQRLSEAHRSHAYQRLARAWGSHKKVTLLILCINVLWLAPLSWGTLNDPPRAWLYVLVAYLPLIATAGIVGAGKIADA